ncbi:alginate export family protein [Pedobacter aquatilis]|uniref:alginate export family protein n=1 Tax=Pedobacter aquatilis TaxID=351343 RepID=UPI00292CB9E4|nr:alginate export family protein [Pedobacter aquatilis]
MKNIIILVLLFASSVSLAQENSFKQLRYEENYETLKNDSSRSWYDQLKFKPLSHDQSIYLSLGGEVRYQYFYFKNENWGESPKDNDGFVLNRYLGHVDFHGGKYFRIFAQLQSSMAAGKEEVPSPVDQNVLDLHQAFVDFNTGIGAATKLTFRVGRQELAYGSQRLVSVREAPNNRQSFDAVKIMVKRQHIKIDGFYSYYVPAKAAIFDDRFSADTKFWGVYSVFTNVPVIKNLDFYYLGIHKKNAVYDDGKGIETRHSVGGRFWNTTGGFQYDVEGLYQFGDLNQKSIAAWTLSANLSYSFLKTKHELQAGIKAEAISGDKNYGDGRLNTFNPLFPKGAYFGLAALIGPYNLLDAHPYVEYNLTKKLVLAADYDLFWRMNRNDGLYAVNGKLIYSGKNVSAKHIGRQIGAELRYSPNKFLYLRQEITWFNAGEFLKQAGTGKDILMFGSTIIFKF